MQNLFHLLKTTLLEGNAEPPRFLYPRGGMQEAWVQVSELFEGFGGRIITGVGPDSKVARTASRPSGQAKSASSRRW